VTKKQIEQLTSVVYVKVFQLLDCEQEIPGIEGGAIATKTSEDFKKHLEEWNGAEND
jgi:hypothetical protein